MGYRLGQFAKPGEVKKSTLPEMRALSEIKEKSSGETRLDFNKRKEKAQASQKIQDSGAVDGSLSSLMANALKLPTIEERKQNIKDTMELAREFLPKEDKLEATKLRNMSSLAALIPALFGGDAGITAGATMYKAGDAQAKALEAKKSVGMGDILRDALKSDSQSNSLLRTMIQQEGQTARLEKVLGFKGKQSEKDKEFRAGESELSREHSEKIANIKHSRAQKIAFNKKADALAGGLKDVDLPMKEINELSGIIKGMEDIPGVGLGAFKPDAMLGEKGRLIRQRIASIVNKVARERFGTAQTVTELRKAAEEFGTGTFKTDEALRQGLENLRLALIRQREFMLGSVEPEVLDYLKRRPSFRKAPKSGTMLREKSAPVKKAQTSKPKKSNTDLLKEIEGI